MEKPTDGGAASDPNVAKVIQDLKEFAAQRPSIALTNGKSAKTAETVRRIIEAALSVFISDGYAGLTLRKVAHEADIVVGNLTYHFSAKYELVRAALDERLAQYIDDHLFIVSNDRASVKDVLLDVVEYYIRVARASHRLSFQLWGYAGASEETRNHVHSLFRPVGRLMLCLVRSANPQLDSESARRIVLQIYSLEQGYRILAGLAPQDYVAFAAVERDIRELTKLIVFRS